MTRSRRARLGGALESTGALQLTGRTWDDPFEGDPDGTETALVVEVEPFPADRYGTIVPGNTASPTPDADNAHDGDGDPG
ncbi:hypothetical protein HCA61_22525 [Rhodococcus sp. HNM0563]|uniref:hypothetical protein n=1 Tax=Rhodococcus sp. HNM0563 TaxID=2716339 RepID=UPI00146EB616|nr:hypothetical protein [Rhodococcus sp. HNM0563]NLU65016.1 hypothetical protein [Rhodococcus sp. HNM0563]